MQRRELLDAVCVVALVPGCRDEFGEHRATRAAVLGGSEHREQELMRTGSGTPGGLRSWIGFVREVEHRSDKVDTGPPCVTRLDEPGVDVDVRGMVGSQNGVQGQWSVPSEGLAEYPKVFTDDREVDAALVARSAVGTLSNPKVGM